MITTFAFPFFGVLVGSIQLVKPECGYFDRKPTYQKPLSKTRQQHITISQIYGTSSASSKRNDFGFDNNDLRKVASQQMSASRVRHLLLLTVSDSVL
jgi:hypothetical protein